MSDSFETLNKDIIYRADNSNSQTLVSCSTFIDFDLKKQNEENAKKERDLVIKGIEFAYNALLSCPYDLSPSLPLSAWLESITNYAIKKYDDSR